MFLEWPILRVLNTFFSLWVRRHLLFSTWQLAQISRHFLISSQILDREDWRLINREMAAIFSFRFWWSKSNWQQSSWRLAEAPDKTLRPQAAQLPICSLCSFTLVVKMSVVLRSRLAPGVSSLSAFRRLCCSRWVFSRWQLKKQRHKQSI